MYKVGLHRSLGVDSDRGYQSFRVLDILSLCLLSETKHEPSITMGGITLHANGTDDPPAVRNWRVHMIALVASMGWSTDC